jgi:hypothetical protein
LPAIDIQCTRGEKHAIGADVFDVPDAIDFIFTLNPNRTIQLRYAENAQSTEGKHENMANWFEVQANTKFDAFVATESFEKAVEMVCTFCISLF